MLTLREVGILMLLSSQTHCFEIYFLLFSFRWSFVTLTSKRCSTGLWTPLALKRRYPGLRWTEWEEGLLAKPVVSGREMLLSANVALPLLAALSVVTHQKRAHTQRRMHTTSRWHQTDSPAQEDRGKGNEALWHLDLCTICFHTFNDGLELLRIFQRCTWELKCPTLWVCEGSQSSGWS